MDPYYSTGKIFVFTIKDETRVWRFCGFQAFAAKTALGCHTFEINGHEASVIFLKKSLPLKIECFLNDE